MAPVNRNRPKRAKSSDSRYTMMDFTRDYPDDATCLDYLWRTLYSEDGRRAFCRKCDRKRTFHRVKSRPSYSCDSCGRHINPTAGTIFHKSSTSLHLWFHAIFLMAQTRCGISAKQLERELGVTYKTAWRMFKQIRSMLGEDPWATDNKFAGTVEVDDAYMGGRHKWRHASVKKQYGLSHPGRAAEGEPFKTPVLGIAQRGTESTSGKVHARVVPNVQRETVQPVIHRKVALNTKLYTDEFRSYARLNRYYNHRTVRHDAKVYVDGDVHTNTIEGFWSLVKRGISGVYHGVGEQYLQSYLDEYTFRYNHRDAPAGMFHAFLGRIARA